MSKTISNYRITLKDTLISIFYKGELIKAFDTKPLHSVDDFKKKAIQIQNMVDLKIN